MIKFKPSNGFDIGEVVLMSGHITEEPTDVANSDIGGMLSAEGAFSTPNAKEFWESVPQQNGGVLAVKLRKPFMDSTYAVFPYIRLVKLEGDVIHWRNQGVFIMMSTEEAALKDYEEYCK